LAGQVLAKIDGTDFNTHWVDQGGGTGYATEAWVLSQGYITVSALTPYLTSAAAASTYLTITNAASTYATNAALSSYLTVAAASSTYYPLTNPSSFITSSALSPYLTSALAATTYAPIAAKVPTGGTTGQVLAKSSATDYATIWETPAVGDKYYTISTTSLSVSNGVKTLTVGTGLSYTTQQDVIIAYDAAHHMHAVVTSYNSGTGVLVVDVRRHTGTGTFSLWTVNVGGISSVAEWGLITGTITNQTDLSTALGSKLPLAGGTMDASATIVLSTATYDSLVSGEVFGVELTADPTQNASLAFNALTVQDGVGSMQLRADGLTFPDATTQSTGFPGFAGYATEYWVGSQGYLTSVPPTPPDQTKADLIAGLVYSVINGDNFGNLSTYTNPPAFLLNLGMNWGIVDGSNNYYSFSGLYSGSVFYLSGYVGGGPYRVRVNSTDSSFDF
jgi:hypothetical protein